MNTSMKTLLASSLVASALGWAGSAVAADRPVLAQAQTQPQAGTTGGTAPAYGRGQIEGQMQGQMQGQKPGQSYGQGYGPGMMGQGYGPGMMGQGYGPGMGQGMTGCPGMMMGGGMMGPGMMGPGMMGQGMMGQGMPGQGMMGQGMMGQGMMTGPGMMGSSMAPAQALARMGVLDLTDQQVAQLEGIRNEALTRQRALMRQMWEEQDKLNYLYSVEQRDAAAIGKVYSQLSDLQRQALEAHINMENRVSSVLTKEQRAQVRRTMRHSMMGY